MSRLLREVVLWAGALLGLVALAAGVAVTCFGFTFLVFRSGSMSPDIPTGAIALARTVPAAQIRPGDVVSVVASGGERVTHRVVSSTVRDGSADLVLQGDANRTPDDEIYHARSAPRVVASLPWGGYVVAHALTPPGLLALACVAGMLLLLGWQRDAGVGGGDRGDGDDGRSPPNSRRHAGPRTRRRVSRRLPHRLPRRGLAAASAVALTAVLAGSGTTDTLAYFTDRATAQTGTFTASNFFTCDAVGRGLAGAPYLYYKLDETGTSLVAADASGNARVGTYATSGVTLGQPKACANDTGTSVKLDGKTGAIYPAANSVALTGPNTFTLSIWFKTTATGSAFTGGKLIGFGNALTGASTNYDRHLYLTNAGNVVFGVYPNAVKTIVSPKSYSDGAWHYAVASLSSQGMKLYLDGSLVASDSTVTTAQSYAGFWRVGYDNLDGWTNVPSSRFFGGTLDEVSVFVGSAPTDAAVAQAYVAGL